jgi:hypothetical protein
VRLTDEALALGYIYTRQSYLDTIAALQRELAEAQTTIDKMQETYGVMAEGRIEVSEFLRSGVMFVTIWLAGIVTGRIVEGLGIKGYIGAAVAVTQMLMYWWRS